ncbi:NADH:ubiquinone oxidoreductase, partial [Spiromyces aspiralis]
MAEHLVCESEAAPPPSFIYKRVEDMIQQPTPFASRLEESMRVVDEALDRYGEDGLALTFNGGKDCTVLLHLLCAALEKRKSVTAPTNGKRRTDRLKCLYVENHAVFPEVEKFVAQSERQYDLDLVKIKSDMKSALRSYMDMRPGVKAFLVGTRRNDPHGTKLQYFTPSDPDWPPLMR